MADAATDWAAAEQASIDLANARARYYGMLAKTTDLPEVSEVGPVPSPTITVDLGTVKISGTWATSSGRVALSGTEAAGSFLFEYSDLAFARRAGRRVLAGWGASSTGGGIADEYLADPVKQRPGPIELGFVVGRNYPDAKARQVIDAGWAITVRNTATKGPLQFSGDHTFVAPRFVFGTSDEVAPGKTANLFVAAPPGAFDGGPLEVRYTVQGKPVVARLTLPALPTVPGYTLAERCLRTLRPPPAPRHPAPGTRSRSRSRRVLARSGPRTSGRHARLRSSTSFRSCSVSFARAFRPAVVAVVVLAATALTACGGGNDGARGSGPVDRKAAGFLGAQLCITNVNLSTASVLLKPEFDETPESNPAWKNNDYRTDGEAFPPGTTKCVENENFGHGSGYARVLVGGGPARSGWAFWINAFNGYGDPGVRVGGSDVFRDPCPNDVSGYSLASVCQWAEYTFTDGESGWVDPYVDWDRYTGTPCNEWFKVRVTRLADDDRFKRFSAEVRQARVC